MPGTASPVCLCALSGSAWYFFFMFSFFPLNVSDGEMMVHVPGNQKLRHRVQAGSQGLKAKAGRVCNGVLPFARGGLLPSWGKACCWGFRAEAGRILCLPEGSICLGGRS